MRERSPMYFCGLQGIKYNMRRIFTALCSVACCLAVAGGALIAFAGHTKEAEAALPGVITVWQIDGFEGGKGSRSDYLRSVGEKFYKDGGAYVEVASLTAEAARANMEKGILPDALSYPSGIQGFESVLTESAEPVVWCRGAYCLISVKYSDFTLADKDNTVINGGKNNLADVGGVCAGIGGAAAEGSTGAYVSLINGKYDFLLGTQRDIVRMSVRGVACNVMSLTAFNDLYQNIAVVGSGVRGEMAARYIDCLIAHSEDISSLCLFRDGKELYSDNLHLLENLTFDYTVPHIAGADYIARVKNAARTGDINLLKTLLKPL